MDLFYIKQQKQICSKQNNKTKIAMGNQICCQQITSQQRKQQLFMNHLCSNGSDVDKTENDSKVIKPQVSQQIRIILNENRPFQKEFSDQLDVKLRTFGKDVYEGPIDLIGRPTKIGKMYKQNETLFVGHFDCGKAQGPCFYVMKDKSYFKGEMKNNYAQCQNGIFHSQDLEYVGGFKGNVFHGNGTQKLRNQTYIFEGIYQNGQKKSGIMKWGNKTYEFIFQGHFDQNVKFTGKGKFIDPQGRYEGQFVNGQKHGYGIYFYNTQIRYQGQYMNNKKQGEGKLYNNDNSVAYKGVFKKGMPNGKGIATSKNGTQFQTEWRDGIDVRLL